MKIVALAISFLSFSWVLACGSSEPAPSKGDTCTTASNAARERVGKVVEENLACSADADCVSVPFGATCFDSCTRAVNQTGKGAVDRAATLVEASECKQFHDAGCKVVVPPCAPPTEAKCVQGKCQ